MKKRLLKLMTTGFLTLLCLVMLMLLQSFNGFTQNLSGNQDLAYEWTSSNNSLSVPMPYLGMENMNAKTNLAETPPKIAWSAPMATTASVTPSTANACYGTQYSVAYTTSGIITLGQAYYNVDGGTWTSMGINTTNTLNYTPGNGTHTYGIEVLGDAGEVTFGPAYATVTVTSTAPTITGTTNGAVCNAGTVTLNATASAGTIDWYAAASGGSSLHTGTSFTTPSISTTTSYYVAATNICVTPTRTTVIATVHNSPAISYTSGGQNQIICSPNAITNTVYTWAGGATSATATGLPAGLTYAVNSGAKTITISGVPTAGGTYTVSTIGALAPCTNVSIQGTITFGNPGVPTINTINNPY